MIDDTSFHNSRPRPCLSGHRIFPWESFTYFFSKCQMSICVVFGQHWFSAWSSLMDAVFALSLSCCWIMNTNLYWGKWKLQCFSCCSWSFPLKKMWRNTETTFPVRIQQKTFKSNYLGHIYLFFGFIYATVRTNTKHMITTTMLPTIRLSVPPSW